MSWEFDDSQDKSDQSFTWDQAWISAFTQPNIAAYERLVLDPLASYKRAYGWIFISSMIGSLLYVLISFALNSPLSADPLSELSQEPLFGIKSLFFLCFAPISGVLVSIGVTISVGLTQLIARVLGGTGTFFQLIYAYAAFYAPLFFVTAILQLIPAVGPCLTLPLAIYSLALYIIATKAVNGFGWGKSILAVIIIPLAIALFLILIFSFL
jgi:hypothetical protein